MTKAQDQADAWAEFHQNLPKYLALLERLPRQIQSLQKDVTTLKASKTAGAIPK